MCAKQIWLLTLSPAKNLRSPRNSDHCFSIPGSAAKYFGFRSSCKNDIHDFIRSRKTSDSATLRPGAYKIRAVAHVCEVVSEIIDLSFHKVYPRLLFWSLTQKSMFASNMPQDCSTLNQLHIPIDKIWKLRMQKKTDHQS